MISNKRCGVCFSVKKRKKNPRVFLTGKQRSLQRVYFAPVYVAIAEDLVLLFRNANHVSDVCFFIPNVN